MRPPAHRGPLLASAVVLLALAWALVARFGFEGDGVGHLAAWTAVAVLGLGLGMALVTRGGAPPAAQSVLLVTGLVGAAAALRVVDGEGDPVGAVAWQALVLAGLALWPALREDSAACALIAAAAATVALVAGADWALGAGRTTDRVLLLASAIGWTLLALVVRGGHPRHGTVLVVVAGLAVAAIGLDAAANPEYFVRSVGGRWYDDLGNVGTLPAFWSVVLLAAGVGLVADGAVEKTPGPVYVGVLVLALFVLTVERWEVFAGVLAVAGAGALIAGLRPRRPLPPEPDITRPDDLPLAVRAREQLKR